MTEYALKPGSRSGVRVVDAATGETVLASGRVLDNISPAGAEGILLALERADAARRARLDGAYERNDLVAILSNAAQRDD